ncbi:MAG: hypothetical protein GX434_06365 [Peptococcaceae bacterium]|nr:hypothetical protein [Peptococcaceae bacterium]
MKDRGAALLTSVIAIIVLALIAGTFYSLSASRARMETSEEKGLKAYYLAEAGIQFGIAHAYQLSDIPDAPVTQENPFGSSYGGSFTVSWIDNGTTVLVRSTGQYQGVTRKLEANFLME